MSPEELESEHRYWESVVADPFIRSCVRGLHRWVLSLGYDDVAFTYRMPHYQVLLESSGMRSRRVVEWYFQGGKGIPGRHIHFRLPRAESFETRELRLGLTKPNEQPCNKRPRKDDLFTFNVYTPEDMTVAKSIIEARLRRIHLAT